MSVALQRRENSVRAVHRNALAWSIGSSGILAAITILGIGAWLVSLGC